MQKLRVLSLRLIPFIIAMCVLIVSIAPPSDAQTRRYRRRHNPQAGKAKAAKRIGIGAAIGAGAGGLIGGRKGALIGAGAGAGAGTAYHVHKKRQWRKRHPR